MSTAVRHDVTRLSEEDLYLFAEGTHTRLYEKLGAHVMTADEVDGTYFAVWAPNARNVSVLGDFNYWDGRKHQMRKGQTGIWELFIPELGLGEHYKYEIKNYDGPGAEEMKPLFAFIVSEMAFGAGGEKVELIPAVKTRQLFNPRGVGARGTFKSKLTGIPDDDRVFGPHIAAFGRTVVTGSPGYATEELPLYFVFGTEIPRNDGSDVLPMTVSGVDSHGNTLFGILIGLLLPAVQDSDTRTFEGIALVPEATGHLERAAGFGHATFAIPNTPGAPTTGLLNFARPK